MSVAVTVSNQPIPFKQGDLHNERNTMALDSSSTATHTTSHTSGFFGADRPTYWSYSFEDWNFESAAGGDFSYQYGNSDDDYFAAGINSSAQLQISAAMTGNISSCEFRILTSILDRVTLRAPGTS